MRIVGGTHRGRRFNPPKGFKSRPTTDIARESLFNILSNTYQLNDVSVFDLFSGSGAVSFEFASRGANQVTSVEKVYPVFKHLIKLVHEFELENIHVLKKDVFKWIPLCESSADIIFADPPFDHPRLNELPGLILENNMVKSGGCLIIEHPSSISFSSISEYEYTKAYGSVNFSFFFVD